MSPEYIKSFDVWNEKMKLLEKRILPDDFFFLEGEIWWVALGVNIGHEIDGKNDMFERPVVVLKRITDDLLWAIPITSTIKSSVDFQLMKHSGKQQTILVSQIKLISNKRLLRLIFRMKQSEFSLIKESIIDKVSCIKTIPSD